MSLIINQNLLKDNVSSVTHTENETFGSFVANTPLSSLYDRSTRSAYEFTTSGAIYDPETHVITINLTDTVTISSLSLLNHTATAFFQWHDFKLYSGATERTISNETSYTYNLNRSGVASGDDELYTVKTFDPVSINKIEIYFWTTASFDYKIGEVYAGVYNEINIKPSSLLYTFASQGVKLKSEGNQVYAERNQSYMEVSFTTTATKETNVVSSYFNINYESSISEPLIFVPDSGQDIVLYGTQEKCASIRAIQGKKDNEWLYEATYKLVEEF